MLAAHLLLQLLALKLKTTDVKSLPGVKGDYEELHSLQERK
jgi:hypothetical protein